MAEINLFGDDRVAADRAWRSPETRQRFEVETGLTDAGTEEYQRRFREWFSALFAAPKRLHPFCNVCGWRKGGVDSWDGARCKCGHSEPPLNACVLPGDIFRKNSAAGVYTSRVLRPHRDAGYWETTIISGGHPAVLNSIQVVSEKDILAAKAAG